MKVDKKLLASRGLHPADPSRTLLEGSDPSPRYRLELRARHGPTNPGTAPDYYYHHHNYSSVHNRDFSVWIPGTNDNYTYRLNCGQRVYANVAARNDRNVAARMLATETYMPNTDRVNCIEQVCRKHTLESR